MDHWDLSQLQQLPEVSWSHLEAFLKEGKSHWQAAKSKWQDAKRSLLQSVYGSTTFRRTATWTDELLAHLRWSTRILQADSRVPMPVEWDSRQMIALLELARVLNEHACRPSSDGSSTSISLPPVTAATCLAQLLVFFKPGGVLLRDVSLSPYCVVDKGQYYRLVTAAFVHVDATHLITNMTACLPDCLAIEESCGSAQLAADLALLTLSSHALYVAFAWLQKSVFVKRFNYYSLVTVGFSGVVFGLKVWAGFKRGGHVYVWGVPFPSRFSWVPTLALTHLCVPEASFPAHIAGVVAGLLRAYCLEPVLLGVRHGVSWTRRRSRGAGSSSGGGQRLQPELQANRQQQPLQGSSQHQDWRLLHHERWLQQAAAAGSPSSSALLGSRQPALGSRQPASEGGIAAAPPPSSTATGSGAGRDHQQPRFGGNGMSVRGLLLDLGLQLGLAVTAAGLYFVLSSGEGHGRLKPSYWRR